MRAGRRRTGGGGPVRTGEAAWLRGRRRGRWGRHEAGKPLSAWLATLAALYPPERVAFLAAGGLNSLVGDATSLPHFAIPAQDGDERSVEELAAELEEAIVAPRDA